MMGRDPVLQAMEVTLALVVLARCNIPPDVQELLIRDDPMRNIAPNALW